MGQPVFAILISTKNRRDELAVTLQRLSGIVNRDTEVVVYDDGSDDGTFEYVKTNFPSVLLLRNEKSQGYLYCRNKMLNNTLAEFAISLDDDANILSDYPLEEIKNYFFDHPKCGLIAMRIFWGSTEPVFKTSDEKPERVKGFVGCGHAWRMESWNKIPDYPEWFVFYGEEDFAAYELFRKNMEVHYLPAVLVHHRVDVRGRKIQKDYTRRLRHSLRSGWYLFFLFYPLKKIPGIFTYSIWMQLKKVFKGDFKALKALTQASIDLLLAVPRIVRQRNGLTSKEYERYRQLADTKIYWAPEMKAK
ncbi:glycosyltransferase family 2 protein [Flavobacterium pallidum]|uniref:Glycosyl transferase n=1 Tax=Flavobacterium pallidum TaxID=2172098 RepID=A0A2S1SGY1_9FLAO|nr:glycosyltransferase [Flavobacterium pallidum]AWI25660.1 glycosyl transferase [Flavobacterium pallidum]